MLKRSEILEVNKTVIVLNWIKFYYWYDKDIGASINKTLEHYRDMTGITLDISVEEIKNRLKEYVYKLITNNSYIRQELNLERKKYISPSYKNISEFFIGNELNFRNVSELQNFLLKNVLTELE